MFHKLTEEQEIQIERDRERAKAGWRKMKRVGGTIGFALALSFAYAAGEMQGVLSACGIVPRSEVTSAP